MAYTSQKFVAGEVSNTCAVLCAISRPPVVAMYFNTFMTQVLVVGLEEAWPAR